MLHRELRLAIFLNVLNTVSKRQWEGGYFFEDPLTLHLLSPAHLVKPASVRLGGFPGGLFAHSLLAVGMAYREDGDPVWFQTFGSVTKQFGYCGAVGPASVVNQCKVVFVCF